MGRLKVGHWEIRLQLDGEVGGQNRDKAAVRYKCGGKWMDRPHLALAERKQLGNALAEPMPSDSQDDTKTKMAH